MKRFTLVKNRLFAIHAINLSVMLAIWRNMNWSILVKNLTHVDIALKYLFGETV